MYATFFDNYNNIIVFCMYTILNSKQFENVKIIFSIREIYIYPKE